MSTVTLEEAMDVIDGLLSYAGWPLAKYQKEWDEQSARAGELLERYRQPNTAPQPGPISDSASGGASDSGGVDLSGVKKGDWAMSRKYGPCQLEVSLGSETTWAYPLRWKLSEDVKFSTNLRGRMVSDGIDNPYDIIRLLPENGGGT